MGLIVDCIIQGSVVEIERAGNGTYCMALGMVEGFDSIF